MKQLIPLLAIVWLMLGSIHARAQITYTTGMLTLTETEFTALVSQPGGVKVEAVSIGQYTGTGPDTYFPPDPCPCGDQWTQDYIDFCISEANRLCQPVFPCVRRCDCSWWTMKVCPTDPNCTCTFDYGPPIEIMVFAAP